ncbi:serine hydrolase domain-containing protein [Formosa haliotis]|uniref:serine hydrolase domain-containing protein n=1 Tax=Formosa haliotis TaxID=1555194 RepID=UPI000824F522|nr:serine hydrolase domain-containing protein [Formosa haliotis]
MKNSKPLFLFLASLFFSFNLVLSQSLEKKLDSVVQLELKQAQPGASILVTKNNEKLYQKAFGMADMELGVPLTPNMKFCIGSLTKQFTAVAILLLEQEGLLSTQDPISKFIPELSSNYPNVKIHHLLNHTSGIFDYTSDPSFPQNIHLEN